MNLLESCSILDPFDVSSECGKFIIDDTTNPFILHGVTSPDHEYTLSLYIKSEAAGSINICEKSFDTSTNWLKIAITFTASQNDLYFNFTTAGTYYTYHTQLELGNKATDWSPSSEDLATGEEVEDLQENINTTNERVTISESLIQQLSNCISMLVRDENGESLMTQTSDGWVFSMGETNDAVSDLSNSLNDLQNLTGDTAATVDVLQNSVENLEETAEYVRITTYGDEPCIELGESDSDFRLLITNTRIMFLNGSDIPTYINTDGLITQNITVEGELRQGSWVWKERANGNYGLQWKEVTS